MKNWLRRIKPKLKNWRWWVTFPIVSIITLPFLIMPIYLFEFLGERMIKLSDWWQGLAETKVASLLIRAIEWSNENEQDS